MPYAATCCSANYRGGQSTYRPQYAAAKCFVHVLHRSCATQSTQTRPKYAADTAWRLCRTSSSKQLSFRPS